MKLQKLLSLLFIVLFISCSQEPEEPDRNTQDEGTPLSIFFINDPHSQLTNFAKIKHIVDNARLETNVLLVAAGDIFSGSPYVDQHPEKGYPIIEVMNQTGFDIAVIGNHEFDYGIEVLEKRIQQSDFPWICANMKVQSETLNQPEPYYTVQVGDLSVTFLGLVETFGQPNNKIPATHPWRVSEVSFEHYFDVLSDYDELQTQENSNVYVALTHLGLIHDEWIAENFEFFDLIIGGHSNNISGQYVDGTPVLMAGGYLSHLGRIDLRVTESQVFYHDISFVDLEEYASYDAALFSVIKDFETNPLFDEVVGNALSHHDRAELGCFYTEALAQYMEVDLSFQNPGGIRSDLDQGDVTKLEVYSIDPFGNGSVVFNLTAREIKDFFMQTGVGLFVYGVDFVREGNDLSMYDLSGRLIEDNEVLRLGINDYIPAVFSDYFAFEEADIQELTTAETLIKYLQTIEPDIDYEGCNQYFQY